MEIQVTGRGLNVRDTLREYAESKAAKLERFHDSLEKIEVLISHQGDEKQVEMIAHQRRGQPIVGTVAHEDPMAAIDLVLDKMTQQLRRMKDKKESQRKRSERVPSPPLPSDVVDEDEDEELESYQDVVEEFSKNLDE